MYVFDVWSTIISQYANSPILDAIITSFNAAMNMPAFIDDWYDMVWNIARDRDPAGGRVRARVRRAGRISAHARARGTKVRAWKHALIVLARAPRGSSAMTRRPSSSTGRRRRGARDGGGARDPRGDLHARARQPCRRRRGGGPAGRGAGGADRLTGCCGGGCTPMTTPISRWPTAAGSTSRTCSSRSSTRRVTHPARSACTAPG